MGTIHLRKLEAMNDKAGRTWVSKTTLPSNAADSDILEVESPSSEACTYYEVLGYSPKREAFWVAKIDTEGIADNLEQELEDHVKDMGLGES